MLDQLSRRLSLRSEAITAEDPSSPRSERACLEDFDKLYPQLPRECQAFAEVQKALQRKNSDRHAQAVAFAGLPPQEAAAAASARERGRLSHAQITRRLTTTKDRTLW